MKKSLLILLLFVSKLVCFSQITLSEELNENKLINKGISYIEDKESKLSLNQILETKEFIPINKDVANFGISPSTYWLKLEVNNKTSKENYGLQISQPGLDEIDFYEYDKNGELKCKRGGECLPFSAREFFDPSYIYKIRLDSTKTNVFYFRIKSRDNFQVPIIIGAQETLFESNKIKDYILGIFSGIMIVMLLYNTFLYVTVRDKTYLFYIIYLATVILTQVSIQGYTFQYLWPNVPFMAQWSAFIFSPMVGIASAYFMRVFLNTGFFCPKLDKGFKYFNAAYLVAVLFSLLSQFHISYLLITLSASLLSMYMLIAAFVVFKKDYKPARFFLLAWFMFLFGVTIYAMTNLGILPINDFTFYTMPFGAVAEVVLLSLALADRINVLKTEKEESQAQALLVSEQNQKLISEQNIVLEQKVQERTIKLEETNEELKVTLTYLKDTQAQLVDAEKMASLGQLTAGIAHEINNPINFVSANLTPLKMDISEVLDVVKRYEALVPNESVKEQLSEIDSYKKKIDLEYLKTEIGTLLMGIEDGAKRTAEIVSGLKNFSRLDESDIKEVNVNEGIESTLVILRSSVPANVEIVTKLSDVPVIECYPGKLNQVFMNVLSNAIYAMKHKNPNEKNYLTISSYTSGEKVCVSFEDTGIGMTKEVQEKIFEPFFTTKDVGEGTGLGMSIVFKIIQSHHAKLEIDSQPDVGTKMTLILNKKLT